MESLQQRWLTERLWGVIMNRKVRSCKPCNFAKWCWAKGYKSTYHIIYGLQSRIPICCLVEWVIRSKLGQNDQAIRSGCIPSGCEAGFVHCGICIKLEHV